MSNFIKLRLILTQAKPSFANFQAQLALSDLHKGDLDLLLNKAVEVKIPDFAQFCQALINKGANVNFNNSKDFVSNLMIACEKGNIEMVSALLACKDLNLLHVDARQLHAGFYAIENRSSRDSQMILRRLLQRQPTLVNKEAGNQTLLIVAIRKSKVELVKLLLEAGADANWQVPDTGNSPLHDAVKQLKMKVSKAMSEIIRLLLLHGGDSTKKNKQQKTVYDYAEKALGQYQKIEQAVRQQLIEAQTTVQCLLQLNNESDLINLQIEANRLFGKYQGKDSDDDPFIEEISLIASLTAQIYQLQRTCLQQYNLVQGNMSIWILKLSKMLEKDNIAVQAFGSYAYGLWIRQSNINLRVFKRDNRFFPIQKDIVQKIIQWLKKYGDCKNVYLSRNSKMIKAELKTQGDIYRSINITLNSDYFHNDSSITCFILKQLQDFPLLQPMFYVLKRLTCRYKLNQPTNGGIRTYALVIMLLSCISKWKQPDLGKLLLDFLFYFGFYYEYQYQINLQSNIDINTGQQYINPQIDLQPVRMILQIIDPLNNKNNLGKNIRAVELQRMFRAANLALHSNVERKLNLMFQTCEIMGNI